MTKVMVNSFLSQSQETSETEEMQAKVADLRQQLLTAESSEVKVKENLDMAIKEKVRKGTYIKKQRWGEGGGRGHWLFL